MIKIQGIAECLREGGTEEYHSSKVLSQKNVGKTIKELVGGIPARKAGHIVEKKISKIFHTNS